MNNANATKEIKATLDAFQLFLFELCRKPATYHKSESADFVRIATIRHKRAIRKF